MNRFSRNRHRKDGTHKEVIERLQSLGCSVRDLSQNGDPGGPDLLVGFSGRDFQVEVKTEKTPVSDKQVEFMQGWRGAEVVILVSARQAESWVLSMRSRWNS